MVLYSRKANSALTAHATFFFLGLSSMIVYPLLDLDSFVFLRYLGITIYDAESISFFMRRFNLFIGLVICAFFLDHGTASSCAYWSWFLFLSYFVSAVYVYALAYNLLFISKMGLISVFFISISSHGLLVSAVKLMFSRDHIYLDNNPSLRFYIFTCGCFSSGIVVKLLIKFTGGEVFSDTDNYTTLRLFNRLFISFTIISLISSFLLSTFECIDVCEDDDEEVNLFKNAFSSNVWVFTIAYFSWSLSPMMNNLSLTVLHTIKNAQTFQMEYYQFFTALLVTTVIYLTDYFDIMSVRKREYIYNSLYRSILNIIKYRANTPLSPDLDVHQDVRENMETISTSLSIRLFRCPQPWQSLPYGFWIEWEEYDNFDNNRMLNVMMMHMMITSIRDENPFDFDQFYELGYPQITSPQDHYKKIKKYKYILLWVVCSFINTCNVLLSKLEEVFKNCENCGSCCVEKLVVKECKCLPKNCKTDHFKCLDKCCCKEDTCKRLKDYINKALQSCIEDCNALLYDINISPYLLDSLTVDYKELILTLQVFEEFLMRFVVFMLYGKLLDEYITVHKLIKYVSKRLSDHYEKYKAACTCASKTEEQNCKTIKCCCTMYYKMIKAVCTLHQRQKKACDIMLGSSLESLIDVIPPMSLSRSILLLASFFPDFIDSDLLFEKAKCGCSDKEQKRDTCCCVGYDSCHCSRFSSRVDDILNLILSALANMTDSDPILTHVITVLSSFSSFKYPTAFHDSIFPIAGIPPFVEEKTEAKNVLCVFSTLYTQFSHLMATELPLSHLRPGSPCDCCQNEAGLCPCMRELLSCMREVCCAILRVQRELGIANPAVCHLVDYTKVSKYYTRLLCCCNKLKTVSGSIKQCSSGCCGTSTDVCGFINTLTESLISTVNLVQKLNDDSNNGLDTLNGSLSTELSTLNEKNKNMYKSLRGTRLGMLNDPSNMFSKLITYYKKNVIGRVPDYKKWEFYLFFLFTFTCLVLIYLARLLPYLRNVPNEVKFKYLIILYSLMTSYYFSSSFGFLSSFGRGSSYMINLAIIFGIAISIIYSWLTQWFTYRMFLFEQFTDLYSRFRLLFPGSKYSRSPTLFWWVEGFVSFIKMDLFSMYYLITLTNSKETYNPFSFGFSAKLNVEYDLVESDPHIFTEEDCMRNTKKSVFESRIIELRNLLDYRSFYHVYVTDPGFMKVPSSRKIDYPFDLLYHAWVLGSKVSEKADRLYHLRELAIKAVEKTVQNEAKASDYDIHSITKLKLFFEFEHECLLEAPQKAIKDSALESNSFLSLQSRKLVKLYERMYSERWNPYFQERNGAEPQPSQPVSTFEDVSAGGLMKLYNLWRAQKMRNCDQSYDRNELCKVAVTRTCREFENFAYQPLTASEIMSEFMKLVSKSFTAKDIPKNLEVIKYLAKPVKANENRDVRPVLDEIASLIRGYSFGARSSIIMDFIGVCKNIAFESSMAHRVYKYDKFLIGEWIRWQGLHITGDLVTLLIDFLLF